MKPLKLFVLLFIMSILVVPAHSAQRLKSGKYSRYHQNRNFRISPPSTFDKIRPSKHGVRLFNAKDKVTITIDGLKIENPKNLSDHKLLMRFKKPAYRNNFFDNLEEITKKTVTSHKFKTLNGKKVFEFTMADPNNTLLPLQSIVFFQFGKEFRISLEAENKEALRTHQHFIRDIFQILGIIE